MSGAQAIDPVADLLGGGRVIAYRPEVAQALGDPLAALFVLQFWWWMNNYDRALAERRDESGRKLEALCDGDWIAPSQGMIFAATGLRRPSQETARKRLRSLGILAEARRGVPARTWYRVDKSVLYRVLRDWIENKEEGTTGKDAGVHQTEDDGAPASSADENAGIPQTGLPEPSILDCDSSTHQDAGIPQAGLRDSSTLDSDDTADRDAGIQHSYIEDHARSENSIKTLETAAEQAEYYGAAADLSIVVEGGSTDTMHDPTPPHTTPDQALARALAQVFAGNQTYALKSAHELIERFGAPACERQLYWLPYRHRRPDNPGGALRNAITNDLPMPPAAGKPKQRQRDNSAQRPAEPKRTRPARAEPASTLPTLKNLPSDDERAALDGIWETLSACAKDRLKTQAVDLACTAVPFQSDRIRLVAAGHTTSGSAPARTLERAKYMLLAERATNPIPVNGRDYYDEIDANEAQVELDFE